MIFIKKLLLAGLLSLFAFPSFAITQPTQSTTIADVDTVEQSSCITISNNLRYRMRDASVNNEVSDLQDFLNMKGYLSSEPTGYFGLVTFRAVKKFQSASGFSPTGYVGPLTRAKIKELTCGGGAAAPTAIQANTPVATYPQTKVTATPAPTPINLPAECASIVGISSVTGKSCAGVALPLPLPVPPVTVLSPNGGEAWTKGTIQTIKWQDNSPVASCKSDSTTGVTICPALALYFYDIKLLVLSDSSSCGTGMSCAQYLPVPYTIAKNVSGSSYSWSVGKFDLYNTGIVGVTNTVSDGAYTIQVCQAGTDTCDSSDSYFKIADRTTTNTPPVINAIPAIPTDLSVGQTITLGWGATDADGDDLSWSVSWGDGSGVYPTFGCTMFNPQNKQNWNFKASHAWEKSGTYIVKATVTDCKGTSNDYSLSVVVGSSATPVPTAPTVSLTAYPTTIALGQSSTLTQTPAPTSKLEYGWTRNLEVNSPYADDVSALQMALTKEGIYTGEATGGFYSQTYLAVKAFQAKYGIESTGFVGPITRAKLNELY